MKRHIYSEFLEKEIIATKYIPRKFKPNEKMKLHHKYWIPDFEGTVKVNDSDIIDGITYYFIKFGKYMNACISYPLSYDNMYELLHNHDSIENEEIINSSKSYSGAEIKFWFIVKEIDFEDPLYKGFWPFLDDTSKSVVADNKYYFVKYDQNLRQKFKISLDKSKL